MKKNVLWAAALGGMLLNTTAMAAPAGSDQFNQSPQLDAGTQLNRFQEYVEREQAAKKISEEREQAQAQVEDNLKREDEHVESEITFQLNKVQVDESRVLSQEEIAKITAKYEGQAVSLNQLYDIVEELNKLYEDKGYITCRAYLQPQKIENGVVTINLLESSVGKAVITGNEHTNEEYILDRIPLKEGDISSINKLNKDILHFNGTNDVQLRIVLKAGEKEGTTDYYIQAKEPKNINWTVFTDNMGSKRTGEYRLGMFFTDRSLSGQRDALTLGTVLTKGTKLFSAMYSYPLGHSGTKLNLSYSANDSEQVKDTDIVKTTGKSHSYTIGISQPWIITDRYRSEITLDYSRQTSNSDVDFVHNNPLLGTSSRFKYRQADDNVSNLSLGLAMTNYGSNAVFYQKHSIVRGKSNHSSDYGGDDGKKFTFYKLSAFYQKVYSNGNQLSLRLDGQYSFDKYLISSRQYYLGGMYSVRGYEESIIGGDGGINFSAEYSVPLSKDRKVSAFWFFDYGRILGESASSAQLDNEIYSTGIGFKASIDKNINGILTFGFPLKRSFDSYGIDKPKSMRVNFMLSAQF